MLVAEADVPRWSPQFVVCIFLLVGCRARPEATASPADRMARIPAGWFWMGREAGPPSSRPSRQVYLDEYAIDKTEVTNADFARFLLEAGSQETDWDIEALEERGREPVTGVLWRDADRYCRWTGKRLPTEAEWEKAARGTDGRRYPWGDAWDASLANTLESELGGVAPVGSYPEGASPYGALDMAGNAAEWVSDYFDPLYYTYAPDENPTGADQVLDHSLRGGSWDSPAEQAQTFFRDSSHSVRPNPRVGFRCALSVVDARIFRTTARARPIAMHPGDREPVAFGG